MNTTTEYSSVLQHQFKICKMLRKTAIVNSQNFAGWQQVVLPRLTRKRTPEWIETGQIFIKGY